MSPLILAESHSAQNPAGSLILIVAMLAIFYVFLIRPQQRRAKAQLELARSVQPGDRVETVAGMHGTVKAGTDDTVDIEIADGVVVTMARGAVRRKITV